MRKTKLGNSNYDFATWSIKTEMKYGSVKLRSAVTWTLPWVPEDIIFLSMPTDRGEAADLWSQGTWTLSSQEKPLDCTFLRDRLFIPFREKSEMYSSFLFSLFSARHQISFLLEVENKI